MNNLQKKQTKFSAWYFLAAMLLVFLFQSVVTGPLMTGQQEVSYDEFREHLEKGLIKEATLEPERIVYTMDGDEGEEVVHNVVRLEDDKLTGELLAADVKFQATPASGGAFSQLLGWIVPLLPLALIWFLIFKQMGKGATPAQAEASAAAALPRTPFFRNWRRGVPVMRGVSSLLAVG